MKRIWMALLVVAGLVLVNGVWVGLSASDFTMRPIAQPESFSGIISQVDAAKKEITVQNRQEERIFHWSRETSLIGSEAISEDLQGRRVTVFYQDGRGNTEAKLIQVQGQNQASGGLVFPFDCGRTLC